MTLTRAAVETILTRRVGQRMAAAGLDGTNHDGGNDDLNDAIWLALDTLGYAVADISNVVDADLTPVTNVAQLLDVAELRTLESIQGNLAKVDFTDGASYSLNQLSLQVDRLIADKRKMLQQQYGIGLGTLTGGVVGLDFQGSNPTSGSSFYPFN